MLGFNLNSQVHRAQSMWNHVVASRANLHVVMQFLVSPERSLLNQPLDAVNAGGLFSRS